jgi:DNA-binding CsgD family transcriptional regulator
VTVIGANARARVADRVEAVCASDLDERALRAEILATLQPVIGFDAYVWLLTDPSTSVGSTPLADVPCLPELPTLIKRKYVNPTNRWTSLMGNGNPTRLPPVVGGHPESPWRAMLLDNEIGDVASATFRDGHGCWGFVDLWRSSDRGGFHDAELSVLADVLPVVTAALRRRQAATFTGDVVSPVTADGPAVLILDDELTITGQTGAATEWLRRLLPTTPGIAPIPAAALNVAAQLLAIEAGVDDNPASARTHVAGLTWVTLRASRLSGGPIAVSIEETPAAPRLDLFARTHAFTPREGELLQLLARGLDTRELGKAMRIKDFTVHDHLKSIFAKTSLNSRTAVLTAAVGASRSGSVGGSV